MPCLPPPLAALATALGFLGLTPLPVSAAPDRVGVASVFHEASLISERDAGRLWGQRLYGPMLIVDPMDMSVVANQPDGAGVLKQLGAVYTGTLPSLAVVSNTPVEWSGKRWTELLWPLHPKGNAESLVGNDWRAVELAHEMFHRIQPSLGLTRPEIANVHLDTMQGRYLLRLEWRALAQVLTAPTAEARRAAVADTMLFRAERHRLFPAAAVDEATLEMDEGIAEYTGVRLGLETPQARTRYAVYDLSAFVDAPTYVRAFPYASGPAYGLLLDSVDPAWRDRFGAGQSLDQLLISAMRLSPPELSGLKAHEAFYDSNETLYSFEVKRDQMRQAHLSALRAALVDGPVLRLPLHHANYEFNPQTLQPLGDFGTVYPTIHLRDDWGTLRVDNGGALLDKTMTRAVVSAKGAALSKPNGDGWHLTLNKGWAVQPGSRTGDMIVGPIENQSR